MRVSVAEAKLAFTSDNMIKGYGPKPLHAIIDEPPATNCEIRNVRLGTYSDSIHIANHLLEQARRDPDAVEANQMIDLGL